MENGAESKWGFQVKQELKPAPAVTVRTSLASIIGSVNTNDPRPVISLGPGDPTTFPCFRTATEAEDAIVDAVRSANFNFLQLEDYLNRGLPYKLSPDDVYITLGCKQAIEVILTVLARPGANILLPRPGWPFYEGFANLKHLEVRHFDLLPEKGWEVDLDAVEALADENTVAMVIINPGNPCGNVFTCQHLQKIAETARKLRIMVIADEVYEHLTFGSTPYTPMGAFGSVVPVITVGSISKRWVVPGWRFGWLVTNDPNGILQKIGVVDSIKDCLSIYSDIPTFIQGAVPQILEKTKEDFFSKIIGILKESAELCYDRIKEIPCLTCPNKPEGSMFVMVKLNLSLLEDINDDSQFALKLAQEESVIVTPGETLGLGNWLRIAFSVEPSALEEGFGRIKAFCQRHSKPQ
ncbi:Tyrosine aminotransferase [Melia azedarach]|uniref:Tyrosine aminotransferase n=1 Tax=Melia azedarach TaxID=155640 RepID=A0ACC1Z2R4_MELAZ|nr:Tyrosine aminotransferase [Melia azedarach]